AAEHCWREYRRQAFGGVLMAIVASMLVQRTERGDEMFMAMLARHSQQALDLDSEALLDDTDAPRAPAPRPVADDEHGHAPGSERLERFDVALQASAQAYGDPAALLRGEPGSPVRLALELAWETAGIPYAYRLTTRYEVPCVVAGEIRLGDEVLELAGAPGQ